MKTTLAATVGLLAVLSPLFSRAAPKPPAPPARILVALQVMEVPSNAAQRLTSEHLPALGVYDALLKSECNEVTEVSVQTPNDFLGVARYSQVIGFNAQDHGKPTRNILTAPTILEATPHINADGTITVSLKMEVTQVALGAIGKVPMTTSRSMTTLRTFKSGETVLLGGTDLTGQGGKLGVLPETKELLQFVTVTVLPSEVAAR